MDASFRFAGAEEYMITNLKKLAAYYGPYKMLFFSDMLFAVTGAAVTLVIPLIVRYITNTVVYFPGEVLL